MPPRLARSSVATAAPKSARNKNKKRNLNAYAIASHSAPAKKQVKEHRLGEFLDDRPAPKRRRDSAADHVAALDEEDVQGAAKRRKATFDDGDVEEGSDSEGNEWTLGGMAEDDEDSDLDSEEAFGESDEEKFEGFTFRGSKSSRPVKRRARPKNDDDGGMSLDEEESGAENEAEDDFGDEGVDLATMLDDDESDGQKPGEDEESGDSEEDESESSSDVEAEDEDKDDGNDEERNARMRDRLEALDGDQQVAKRQNAKQNTLSVDDLLADLDPTAKKQFAAATKTKKRTERPTTLAAPLPKRQQDRLNREVASQKAKEQLDRWRDTVIQNRRAEFLSFPLKDPDQGEPQGKDKFLEAKPQNELEANIQRIMEESGMASKDGQDGGENEEDALMKAEGMAEQKLDVDEVLQRRAELRKARELLFYEERKAKRISKIKSKSYRRVHRKEKARLVEREREEMEALGLDPMDGDEREKQDRRRAEERMSTKHRDSKWAKQLKQTNRAAWDESAKDSVAEEARRREELRRRVEGREIGSDHESVDEDDSDDDDNDVVTLRELDTLKKNDGDGKGREGLAGMKFMRDADARRKAQNDETVEQIRKELAIQDGDEVESGDELNDQGLGRAIFGPRGSKGQSKEDLKKKEKRPEMEEGSESEFEAGGDQDDEVEIVTESQKQPAARPQKANGVKSRPLARWRASDGNDPYGSAQAAEEQEADDSWFTHYKRKKSRKLRDLDEPQQQPSEEVETQDEPEQSLRVKSARPDAPPFLQDLHEQGATQTQSDQADSSTGANTNGWTLVKYGDQSADSSDNEDEPTITPATKNNINNSTLQHRAFAGDDVAAAFLADKRAQASSEDEKETSTHLPGWGSWTGSGLSKSLRKANAKAKHNPLFKQKTPGGVKRADRADKDLPNVIVSERKQAERKGKRFLAGTLPQGFEKREEYERSLRRPVGPEWGTKEVVQRNTRPRVVVRRGEIVGAMERPGV